MKRLIYCLDGTTNTYDAANPTNVVMAHKSIAETSSDGVEQVRYYDEGVGTKLGEKFTGMAFGAGLMKNILQAYEHLCLNYEPGDQIYIFGFSRGAYTARSFAGLIGICGIAQNISDENLERVRHFYEARLSTDAEDVDALRRWRVQHSRFVAADTDDVDYRASIRARAVPIIQIRYIGVWDTVKTLGADETRYLWHDHELSARVDFARHAVALDERRKKFDVTEWDNIDQLNLDRDSSPEDDEAPYQQKWFPGDHGSVGGGGSIRGLSDAAFEWIMEGAKAAGLELQTDPGSQAFDILPDHLAPISNTAAPHWGRFDKHISRWAINLFGRIDRTGPSRLSEISHSAVVRHFCPADFLPEKKLYRPGALASTSEQLANEASPFSEAEYRSLIENSSAETMAADEAKLVIINEVEYRVHHVKMGDTLSKIARRYLGDAARYPEIFDANSATIENPDRIYINQRILVPIDSGIRQLNDQSAA